MKKLIWFIFILLVMIAIAGAGTAVFYYRQYQNLNQEKIKAKAELDVYNKVADSALLLPKETPVIALVSDKEKLQSQIFFKSAQNGDKVFVYAKAGLAVLFRPGINKIVQMANLSTVPESTPLPATAVLLNGTNTVGLTKGAQNILDKSGLPLRILDKANAKRSDYETNIIYDASGTHQDLAQSLAKLLNATLATTLPAGEATPQSDVVIILGKK